VLKTLKMPIFMVLGGIAVAAFVGGLIALIGGKNFLQAAFVAYVWFGAPSLICAFIMLAIPNAADMAYGLSAGVYYGGLFLSYIFRRIDSGEHYISGFLCAILLCVIAYMSSHYTKPKE